MKQPLVSVVIPTYNRAYCLKRTIDSALQQTYENVEVIVVDDGSTDDTAALVEREFGDDSRVRYLTQPNQGVATARNTGLNASRGEFIALLDSDDVWRPWKVAVQVAVLERFPQAGMVWTDMEAIDAAGRTLEAKHLRTMYGAYRWFSNGELFSESYPLKDIAPRLTDVDPETRVYCGDIFSQIALGNLVHTSTVLLRRERLEKIIGFDIDLTPVGEDYDFHLRTCREGPVAFVDISSIRYQREFGDQLTQPGYSLAFAQSHLKTVMRTLEQDADRIALPRTLISACLADAHGWIGQAALDRGDMALARKHFVCSLRHAPSDLRTLLLLLLAALPQSSGNRLRSVYRRTKQHLRSLGKREIGEGTALPIGSNATLAR